MIKNRERAASCLLGSSTVRVFHIIKKHGSDPAKLIAMLQDIQHQEGYLSRETLTTLAESLRVPLSRVFALATFYKALSLNPGGKHQIHVCLGTACHVAGGVRLLEALQHRLGVRPGGTSADGLYTLNAVRCVGCCGLAPVVVLDDTFHGKMTQRKLNRLFVKKGKEKE